MRVRNRKLCAWKHLNSPELQSSVALQTWNTFTGRERSADPWSCPPLCLLFTLFCGSDLSQLLRPSIRSAPDLTPSEGRHLVVPTEPGWHSQRSEWALTLTAQYHYNVSLLKKPLRSDTHQIKLSNYLCNVIRAHFPRQMFSQRRRGDYERGPSERHWWMTVWHTGPRIILLTQDN